jgi:hypothetical protein
MLTKTPLSHRLPSGLQVDTRPAKGLAQLLVEPGTSLTQITSNEGYELPKKLTSAVEPRVSMDVA